MDRISEMGIVWEVDKNVRFFSRGVEGYEEDFDLEWMGELWEGGFLLEMEMGIWFERVMRGGGLEKK